MAEGVLEHVGGCREPSCPCEAFFPQVNERDIETGSCGRCNHMKTSHLSCSVPVRKIPVTVEIIGTGDSVDETQFMGIGYDRHAAEIATRFHQWRGEEGRGASLYWPTNQEEGCRVCILLAPDRDAMNALTNT